MDFNFTVVPYPDSPRIKEWETDQGGIFLCFVAGIGLAMIPAALASRIVFEKEYSLKHIQLVSGLNRGAYWLSQSLLDTLKTAISCTLIVIMFKAFRIKYTAYLMVVFLAFTMAIVPFSYLTSYLFHKEITCQTYSIYMNFLFSGVAGMIVFVLRMMKHTALWGDKIQWILRLIVPAFNVCDALVYISTFLT